MQSIPVEFLKAIVQSHKIENTAAEVGIASKRVRRSSYKTNLDISQNYTLKTENTETHKKYPKIKLKN